MNKSLLIIVSCGKLQKTSFPSKAKNAYTSDYFKINRKYAEMFSDRWMILSTKYGIVDPEYVYNEPYDNEDFRISNEKMIEQIQREQLISYDRIEVLGGRLYVEKVRDLFSGKIIEDNLVGLDIHKKMTRTADAIEKNMHLGEKKDEKVVPVLKSIDWDLTHKVKDANSGRFYGPFAVDNQRYLWLRDPDFSTPKEQLLSSVGWRLVDKKEISKMPSRVKEVVQQNIQTKNYQNVI